MSMTLSEELKWRGFLHQTTFEDLTVLDKTSLNFYHGYDAASADSLTIGNLAAVMLDRLLVKHGHKAVPLAGGGTSLIGDPGGKNSERPLQSEETIRANIEAVGKQVSRLLGDEAKLLNNLDWLGDLKLIPFLRDVGKYFSMTPLVQRDYIATRMGEGGDGISYTEFSYSLLQGYDFLSLFDNYGVTLQVSGADQWTNCLSGVELIKKARGKVVNVLTCPLIINKATGVKFGKSEKGAIWLDPIKTSPLEMYQFWINVDDESTEDYLKIFTELDKDAIESLVSESSKDKSSRISQKALAYEVTKLVHSTEIANQAKKVTEILTGEVSIKDLSDDVLKDVKAAMPNFEITLPLKLSEVLVSSGLASSNTEARRLLEGKSVYINGLNKDGDDLEPGDFVNRRLLLRRGKAYKDTVLIELKG
jgi:tyrosyl-tRNA synthetase